jgi:hypothetical protein
MIATGNRDWNRQTRWRAKSRDLLPNSTRSAANHGNSVAPPTASTLVMQGRADLAQIIFI